MDRKKPALTSPWKVGFLVSLLLVVTALGVSYFITGVFGVTWHWIHIGGLSPAEWSFNLGAFIEEMAPLLLLTTLLAFAAHVLVAGAVRRYKAYVDSGVEYKQLLKSIKGIEDLEDDSLVERLKQHPELRDFLLSVKHRITLREKQNGDRPRAHTPSESRTTPGEDRPRLQSETALLVSAIAGGRDSFPSEMALTVPELKQIERSLRNLFKKLGEEKTADPASSSASAVEKSDTLRASLESALVAMRRDVDACAGGARELEDAVSALAKERSGAQPSAGKNVDEIRQRVDATAQALGALGEEARRIAIAAALQASGAPEADSIKVAEELKTLATRFNTLAQHWKQTSPRLHEMLGAPTSSKGGANDELAASAANAVKRARLWSERAVAINEHVRALERLARADGDEPAAAAPAAAPAPSPAVDDYERTPVARARATKPAEPSDDFITRGSAQMFAPDNSEGDVSFADIPGFEKEHRFFTDENANAAEASDDRFVVDSAQNWDFSADRAEETPAPAAPAQESHAGHDNDGFLTGPRPVVSARKIERPEPVLPPRVTAPEVAEETETVAATATLDPDADAVDLYALGAIDCVQTV